MSRRYWIAVASREHVLRGKGLGICQVGHGKPGPLKRMRPEDGLIYYSGKETMEGSEPCRRFTAIGWVSEGEPEQVEESPTWKPWRRKVDYLEAGEAEIRDLIPSLEFVGDKTRWSGPLRFGFLEISQADFDRIGGAMGVDVG